MTLQQQLDADAEQRSRELAARFVQHRCIACGTAGARPLLPTEFLWRKQVSRGEHIVASAQHISTHLLCDSCHGELRGRRRLFFPIRIASGIAVGMALCGTMAAASVIFFMRLKASERSEFNCIGIIAVVLLPPAVLTFVLSRRLSVPAALLDMTRRGWECSHVDIAAVARVGRLRLLRVELLVSSLAVIGGGAVLIAVGRGSYVDGIIYTPYLGGFMIALGLWLVFLACFGFRPAQKTAKVPAVQQRTPPFGE